jgi:hypothetical protein
MTARKICEPGLETPHFARIGRCAPISGGRIYPGQQIASPEVRCLFGEIEVVRIGGRFERNEEHEGGFRFGPPSHVSYPTSPADLFTCLFLFLFLFFISFIFSLSPSILPVFPFTVVSFVS